MPEYHYEFTKKAEEDLNSLDPVVKKRIAKKLQYFLRHPDPLKPAKSLTDHEDGDYRYRVGDYRIIFRVKGQAIQVLKVQHRRDIYRG